MAQAENIEKIETGRTAQAISNELSTRLIQQEEQIILRLVAHHRGAVLTPELALAGVGELAAIRALLDSLDTEIRRGITAANKEMNNG